ncbi:hypothetical protein [Pyxidicoccus fallax]|uniref:hypothetical protein n=1 Tax=Pyxidicoccus fallax TaxID=394095 RepID=UPI001B7D4C57|nr:hypothetical protein [Pyxidicoccus fallax]
MLRRLPSLLVASGLVLCAPSAFLWPCSARAQDSAPTPARSDAGTARTPSTTTPARSPASTRKAAPAAETPAPAAAPAPPPAPAPVQAVEYTFLRREDPEVDLAQLQQLGAEGWQVVATVEVDGSTRRYVLMRPKR